MGKGRETPRIVADTAHRCEMVPAAVQSAGSAPFQFSRYTVVLRACATCPEVDSVTLAGSWTLAQLTRRTVPVVGQVWVVTRQDAPVAVLDDDALAALPPPGVADVSRMVHGPMLLNTWPAP